MVAPTSRNGSFMTSSPFSFPEAKALTLHGWQIILIHKLGNLAHQKFISVGVALHLHNTRNRGGLLVLCKQTTFSTQYELPTHYAPHSSKELQLLCGTHKACPWDPLNKGRAANGDTKCTTEPNKVSLGHCHRQIDHIAVIHHWYRLVQNWFLRAHISKFGPCIIFIANFAVAQ